MYLRRSAVVKYFIAAHIGAALYCEWFVYLVQPIYWPTLTCPSHDPSCTKVLFVADPQIQGDDTVPSPLNYIFNWDSDRYLRSTFSVVLNVFKPHVLVYMGDLMDEGSIASMKQFHEYVRRLSSIFDIDYPVVQVWIPGDNDIGGENEPIKRDKVEEFEKVFHQGSVITHQNISFYKVNAIINSFPLNEGNDKLKIVVSHYPVSSKYGFAQRVNKEISPDIYFSAHDHESKYVKQNKDLSHRETTLYKSNAGILDIWFDNASLYEISVPTCSYRMGTGNIGYGAAILDNNYKHLRYTVFWSSKRFPYLFFYLALLILVSMYCLVYCAAKLFYMKLNTSSKLTDKVPLLDKV